MTEFCSFQGPKMIIYCAIRSRRAALSFASFLMLRSDPICRRDGFQGMEIYNRHTDAVVHKDMVEYLQTAMKDPKQWKVLVAKQKEYPDEVFAAGTDALPLFSGALG